MIVVKRLNPMELKIGQLLKITSIESTSPGRWGIYVEQMDAVPSSAYEQWAKRPADNPRPRLDL